MRSWAYCQALGGTLHTGWRTTGSRESPKEYVRKLVDPMLVKLGTNVGPQPPKHRVKRGFWQKPESKTSQQLVFSRLVCKTSISGSNPDGASIFRWSIPET
jgi:hypothetical protein